MVHYYISTHYYDNCSAKHDNTAFSRKYSTVKIFTLSIIFNDDKIIITFFIIFYFPIIKFYVALIIHILNLLYTVLV